VILNLTQHQATPEQIEAGVSQSQSQEIRRLLTFERLPTRREIAERAEALAEIAEASGEPAAMIGGAPYLMSELEAALCERGITPLYAFSRRESVEEITDSGETVKRTVFKHLGFVEGGTEL
jgi:hypothetical protein